MTQLFLSKKAIDYKRKSIVDILSGKAKGDGRFCAVCRDAQQSMDPVCRHFTLHYWQDCFTGIRNGELANYRARVPIG